MSLRWFTGTVIVHTIHQCACCHCMLGISGTRTVEHFDSPEQFGDALPSKENPMIWKFVESMAYTSPASPFEALPPQPLEISLP